MENKISKNLLYQSDYISRDLSWLKFNDRVLDQVNNPDLNLFEKFKFLAISSSNLDEFLTVRLGSLYNYLDFDKSRIDYSGLNEILFRKKLLKWVKKFTIERNQIFIEKLRPSFKDYNFSILKYQELSNEQKREVDEYFDYTIYPMLTPMAYDHTHVFPNLSPGNLILGVISVENQTTLFPETEEKKKFSFVQIPANLPHFYEFEKNGTTIFLPIEEIVINNLQKLYQNVDLVSISLFRIIRNGDFEIEEYDQDEDFINEIKEKIRGRQVGRVVYLVSKSNISSDIKKLLCKKWDIDELNIDFNDELMNYTRLWHLINHKKFNQYKTKFPASITPKKLNSNKSIFDNIKKNDILLHHPYNSFEPVLDLIEQAADDPDVLSIKLTIYRLAFNSRITAALLRAVRNRKHVSALFEIKARFDEENNIKEAERLQKAGCFVIYGLGWLKTHTKLMLIVRKEGNKVVQYAHLSSGNYNEDTLKTYSDISLLTANTDYTRDIAEFFNVITGHSRPDSYRYLITSPTEMRESLLKMIYTEIEYAKRGEKAGICLKVNSLEDKQIINALYEASKTGVKIELIVRGICCLRPGRKSLSENISVRSLVGNYLEHARILYFHNGGDSRVFVSSADLMVRSFDRRIESIFEVTNKDLSSQLIQILAANLADNYNAYELLENGNYKKVETNGEDIIDIHRFFYTNYENSGLQLF